MTEKTVEPTTAQEEKKRNPGKLPYDSPVLVEMSMAGGAVRGESGYDDGGTGEEEYED
ncbi:MAG: hypothetical protein MJ202_05345 [Lentisphaeria bacterium]|nr:hypothetical protein [Lentisphaeria bacterium]